MVKSGKFVRAYLQTALDRKKKTIFCFLLSLSTPRPLFERGLGKRERFDMAARSETPKPSCQCHKQRQLRPRSGPSKERILVPKQRTASTEPISTIGNRKGDCA